MTAAASGGRRGGAGTAIGIVAVVIGLVAIGVINAETKSDIPYDPKSSSPNGTKAVFETARALGASVDVPDHFPVDDADVAVLFEDLVPADEVDKVHDWVRDGHTLIVTDPYSDFTASAQSTSPGASGAVSLTIERGTCTVDALQNVGRINRGVATGFDTMFRAQRGQVCFANAEGAFVVVTPEGNGQVISIASGLPFTNKYLGRDDNAVLAADLLAPRSGYRIAVLGEAAFGPGSGAGGIDVIGSLGRLVTPGVRLLMLELAVAVLVYGFARGRRLGRPVAEPQPVQIAGSELVAAVGNLLQQAREPSNAGAVLRSDIRRQLSGRLGVPLDAPPIVLAELISSRTGRSREEVLALIDDPPVASESDLVALAQQIDVVREEVLHGQPV
jgi:hypothetical protein